MREGFHRVNQEISTPHDKLFKQLLGEPENAASFLESNLPAELLRHLNLESLQVVQASFIDSQFIQSEADLLFSITVAEKPGYVYFLFEHQSSPDSFMMLRLLGYMVRVWKRFQQENPTRSLLPVIIPMVLFHGEKSWRGPLDFNSLVDMPDESFSLYTPHFQCTLFDLSPFGVEGLAGNAIVRIMGELLAATGRADFEVRLRRAIETLDELANAPGFARYLEILFRYVLHVFDIPKEELGRIVTQRHDVKELLMTTAEQLKQEGRLEEAGRVSSQLLSLKFQADIDSLKPLLGRLNIEQQEELIERIIHAHSLDEITEWLKSAAQN